LLGLVRYDLLIEFSDAVFGCKKEITIDRLAACTTCDGSGQKAGTTPTGCEQCGGQGQIISNVRTPLGTFQQMQVRIWTLVWSHGCSLVRPYSCSVKSMRVNHGVVAQLRSQPSHLIRGDLPPSWLGSHCLRLCSDAAPRRRARRRSPRGRPSPPLRSPL
jgi:hypothetical protein